MRGPGRVNVITGPHRAARGEATAILTQVLEGLANSQANLAEAVRDVAKVMSGHVLAPDTLFVLLKNPESNTFQHFVIPFCKDRSVMDAIYNHPSAMLIRRWPADTLASLQRGEKQVRLHLWDSVTNQSFLSWGMEQLTTVTMAELYRCLPKYNGTDKRLPQDHPVVLHLTAEDATAEQQEPTTFFF